VPKGFSKWLTVNNKNVNNSVNITRKISNNLKAISV
jgi:hypothetical protein